ncbi:MAG TPA: PSD1 and planctomycete cytochrome C domain-containing protein [Opitutaceae bacterium]|nr:PSD1 and planctomycete cytochrome C domain-containing protein [Opitutaceae bacterium]
MFTLGTGRILAAGAAAPAISPADLQFFEARIRPVLVDRCYKCHSREADNLKGGLMLDTQEGVLHGGNGGAVIVPGKPDDSVLIQAIRYTDPDLQMPPKGEKLTDQQVADFTEWVRRGAPDPRSLAAKGSAPSYGGVGRDHWSFLPVKKPAVPAVQNAAWCQTPIDNFILEKLEGAGMSPNPPADKRTLIRRVTFDLIGLPPTEQEIQAFLADNSPGAFATVVDRLLASPHYGERWGRYWLDVARYADTMGDPPKKQGARMDPRYTNAWTYRDYVINAFNQDKPFNQFIVEQIAADRVIEEAAKKAKTPVEKMDGSTRAALGFLTLGNRFEGRIEDIVNDRIDVTTKAFLGLTVSCARCHDHKFDPIPQKDYYSLYGIFANTVENTMTWDQPFVHPVPKNAELAAYLAKVEELKKKLANAEADLRANAQIRPVDRTKRQELLRAEQEVEREIGDNEANNPGAPPRANAIFDVSLPHDFPVLIRGEATNKGEVVPRRFLEILSPDPKKRPVYRSGSGRLELAEAIASPTNPMTARVLVNRLWQQHFGEGFVSTPDDLGNMSSPPTHPELLDYLASRFMEEGWSVKKLQRLIVLSAVYQESAGDNPRYTDTDPDNKLHWRFNLRRLDFEQVHDSLLALAGTLDPTMGGRSVRIESADFATRRAVYAYIDRANPAEILTQFDFPNPSVPTGRRYETIVPQQSLFMMNSTLVIETARKLTERPEFLEYATDEERVTSLYLAVFQRPPTRQEIQLSLRYVQATPPSNSVVGANEQRMAAASSRAARQQVQQAQRAAQNLRGKNVFQGEPGAAAFTSRAPLDAWTKLAHALFQTNEAMFYD